ncbi:hypothetical protein [Carboxylicivirga taeanensis]|uniref:hypothetical protein n=1 Tax=Carboxylicivirga taeanensis TaxID=1416875 RepID=UPI003F6E1CB2
MKKGKRVNSKLLKKKKEGKKYYRILVGLAIYAVIYYYFFRLDTIGYDIRYNIFVIWLPILIGLLCIGYYRRNYLSKTLKSCNRLLDQVLTGLFLLLLGLIYSYFSFGITSKLIWDYTNSLITNKSNTEIYQLSVEKFNKGSSRNSSASVGFRFQERYELLQAHRSKLNMYWNSEPHNFEIEIRCKKCFWNKYLVESWQIIEMD